MKRFFLILALALVSLQQAAGQALTLTDTRFYGNNNNQTINPTAAIQTRDKGIAFVGWSDNTGGGGIPGCTPATQHGIIGKLDSNGNLLWIKANCNQFAYAKSICETPDGGFATNGLYNNRTGGMSIIRYDNAGNFLWEREYGAVAGSSSFQVINTADHGFMLLGITQGRDSDITFTYVWPKVAFPPNDWVLIKLDSLGNKQWAKTFGTSGDEYYAAELITDGTNYYVVGQTASLDHECADVINHKGPSQTCYLLKFDSSGNFLWSKANGAVAAPFAMYDERDNTIMISGSINGNAFETVGNHGSDDMVLMKLDTSGNYRWSKQYGDSGSDKANGLCKGPGNTYLLAGTSFRLNLPAPYTSQYDCWLYYVDNSGGVIDHKRFGGYDGEGSTNVFPYKGDYVVLGASSSGSFLEGTGTNYKGTNALLSRFEVAPVGVSISPHVEPSFVVAPNPAHAQFELRWQGNHAGGRVSCVHEAGVVIYKSEVGVGASALRISTASWPPGSYVVCWDAANRQRECQTIIIH